MKLSDLHISEYSGINEIGIDGKFSKSSYIVGNNLLRIWYKDDSSIINMNYNGNVIPLDDNNINKLNELLDANVGSIRKGVKFTLSDLHLDGCKGVRKPIVDGEIPEVTYFVESNFIKINYAADTTELIRLEVNGKELPLVDDSFINVLNQAIDETKKSN